MIVEDPSPFLRQLHRGRHAARIASRRRLTKETMILIKLAWHLQRGCALCRCEIPGWCDLIVTWISEAEHASGDPINPNAKTVGGFKMGRD